jgi:RNA polymerase sigma factor (TIGR02999 family)
MNATTDTVAHLMGRFRLGDRQAAAALVELFYPQLKRLASAKMRTEATPHTWQPTVLVHELYLELVKIRALQAADSDTQEEQAFLRLSAHLMRRLLIHHARPLARRLAKESIDLDIFQGPAGPESLYEIDSLLNRLAEMDPQLRTVVELRVFEGLTVHEVSERIGSSDRTVARYWTFARNWLAQQLTDSR